MSRFFGHGAAAVGSDKTGLNLFNPVATPLTRAMIDEFNIGAEATPADQATDFKIGRTTAVGTEGSGFTPNNLDPNGPAGEYDLGVAHSVEPTYTSNKELFQVSLNQRATFRWVANPRGELWLPATQNNGAGLKASSSTGSYTAEYALYFLA